MPAETGANPAPEPPTENRGATEYPLSEAPQSDTQTLAKLAPDMKEAALRVLIHLRALTAAAGSDTITISTTALATQTKLAQSAVRRALAELAASIYITVSKATPTKPTAIQVNAFKTASIPVRSSVPLRGTPCASKGHTGCLFEAHPVPLKGTPPTENTALARAAAASDLDPKLLILIDHVHSAKAKNFDRTSIEAFRRWLHGYMAKCGRNAAGDRYADTGNPPHPPSDDQVAQVLAIADERTVTRALETLLTDGHEPTSYYWFVAVLLQRIHGVTIAQRKAATARLVDVKRQAKRAAQDAGQLPDKQYTEQLLLNAVAGVKGPR